MDAIEDGEMFNRAAAAQDRLVDALTELQDVKIEALLGRGYDSSAYDDLIRYYRRAKREAEAARAAWAVRAQSQTPQNAANPTIEPTPRLRFARWLYQAGLISG